MIEYLKNEISAKVNAPEERRLKVNDIEMAYYKHGTGINVWILLHGNRDKKEYLEPIARTILKKGNATVYNIDLRGHGNTGKPSYYYSTDMLVDDMLEFIKAMKIDKFNILGHSLGAMIAVLLNNVLPNRIAKMILISASPHFKPKFRPENLKDYKEISMEDINRKARGYLFSEKYPDVADRVIGHWREIPESVHKSLLGLAHPDLKKYLHNIKCKTMLVYGGSDYSAPRADRELVVNSIKNCTLDVIDGCSHYVYLEEPDKVCRLIFDFI